MTLRGIVLVLVTLLLGAAGLRAQGELAATLEVLTPGVEMLRVNTSNWISLNVEAIVGVGDRIRTDATGSARITFFADGVDTELLPNTEYTINRFEGGEESFNLSVEVFAGQTVQRLERLLDANSSYDVTTPGMQLAARGTQFAIRVEQNGRSAMLVSVGNVAAQAAEGEAGVPAGFGVRAAVAEVLSDVVRATNFAELDSGLDGCSGSVDIPGDVRLNVRLGPSGDFPAVGTIPPTDIDRFFGVNASGSWYRIPFRDAFGWVLAGDDADLLEGCAGLRTFEDTFGPEDPAEFSSLGDPITLEELMDFVPATPEATPEATAEPE